MLLVGFEKKSGVYNEAPWSNYYLYLKKTEGEVHGTCTEVVKIKPEKFEEFLKNSHIDISNCLNRDIEVSYNRFGNVDKLFLVK